MQQASPCLAYEYKIMLMWQKRTTAMIESVVVCAFFGSLECQSSSFLISNRLHSAIGNYFSNFDIFMTVTKGSSIAQVCFLLKINKYHIASMSLILYH